MSHSTVLTSCILGLSILLTSKVAPAAESPQFQSVPTVSGSLTVGNPVKFNVAALDLKGSPLTIMYDYGNGSSDALGMHSYSAPGVYPVTVTISNGVSTVKTTISLVIKDTSNLWIKKQTVHVDSAGKESWSAQYIYNADRTLANIFNPASDDFIVSLGNIPPINISPSVVGAPRLTGTKPKLIFKSAKGAKPAISVSLDESKQTIIISGTSETFPDTVPDTIHNSVQLGKSNYSIDEFFDAKGAFTPTSGYRSAAFVVNASSIKIIKPGKDSATLSMLLGDPAFAYPGTAGSKVVHVRLTNVVNQIILDTDFTSIIAKGGKLTAPAGAFSYDSKKGTLNFKSAKATLTGFLVTSEENVKVEVTIGEQVYTTHVTLFTSGCGKTVLYSTKLPKKFCKFIPGRVIDTTAPKVITTIPADTATGISTNSKISAMFSEPMDPSSINISSFTLTQAGIAVSGTVTYSTNGSIATFAPASILSSNSLFTATITTAAKDLAGNPLISNFAWNFTTSAVADTTPPTVVSTNPADQAVGIAINQTINATFSEAMDASTISTANFSVADANKNSVSGTIAYDSASKIATFSSASDLTSNTQYSVTITTAVKDLAGNALAVNKAWTFTTGSQRVMTAVPLGAIAPYGTFGGGSGMTNQGIFTVINGDIGTTGASTTVTGFHDSTGDIYTETPLNKGQVNGRIYTAPPTPGGAGVGGNASTYAIGVQAAADANDAYNKLTPASMPGGIDPGAGQLGGLTLPPGIYKAAGDTFMITGSDLTLDAHGDSNAVWVFQMGASLTVGAPAAPRSVILTNGAQAKNVFWQVGSSATINAAGGGTMVGTIIASAGITFSTVGNVELVTLNGRAIGLNASTTLVNTIINVPAP